MSTNEQPKGVLSTAQNEAARRRYAFFDACHRVKLAQNLSANNVCIRRPSQSSGAAEPANTNPGLALSPNYWLGSSALHQLNLDNPEAFGFEGPSYSSFNTVTPQDLHSVGHYGPTGDIEWGPSNDFTSLPQYAAGGQASITQSSLYTITPDPMTTGFASNFDMNKFMQPSLDFGIHQPMNLEQQNVQVNYSLGEFPFTGIEAQTRTANLAPAQPLATFKQANQAHALRPVRQKSVKGSGISKPQRFECLLPFCKSTFGRGSELRRHLNAHTNEKLRCMKEGCEYKSTRKDKIREHMRKMHQMEF
ncbi:hypothetical protein BS50DRAFT_618384 [Corynespora cassiicola Philippines]|uniref:C2H2-type domain-containing protein n=1 Tax=Corynespora cassiicola Philippines TaxID=1448308 RepID=A0A2T2P141_CORCC|nr:hypothetical protein BS50DRAFT_618384 [Corynespora cassiicola Philippines]